MATKKLPKRFYWEYCECGCHRSSLSVGGLNFGTFMRYPLDSKNKHCELWWGNAHIDDGKIGDYPTHEERDVGLRKVIKEKVAELKKYLT